MSEESITPPSTTDHSFDPEIIYKTGYIYIYIFAYIYIYIYIYI